MPDGTYTIKDVCNLNLVEWLAFLVFQKFHVVSFVRCLRGLSFRRFIPFPPLLQRPKSNLGIALLLYLRESRDISMYRWLECNIDCI